MYKACTKSACVSLGGEGPGDEAKTQKLKYQGSSPELYTITR